MLFLNVVDVIMFSCVCIFGSVNGRVGVIWVVCDGLVIGIWNIRLEFW